MNKNTGIVIGGITIVIIAWGIYISLSRTDDVMMTESKMETPLAMEQKEPSMMKNDEGVMANNTDTMMKAGSYEAYAPEKIAKAATGNVVLFFRASWCPTCKAVDADIRANLSKIPADLTILDVDYDNASDLKKKYGVTYQHTFVQVDKEGNMTKKWSASPTLAALVSEVKSK